MTDLTIHLQKLDFEEMPVLKFVKKGLIEREVQIKLKGTLVQTKPCYFENLITLIKCIFYLFCCGIV